MRGRKVISGGLVSAGVCAALALAAAPAGAEPAAAAAKAGPANTAGARTSASGTEPVIIFLKKQWPEAGSRIRSDEIQAAQAPYVGQLQTLGATDMHGYRLVDAISARVPASALGAISASPGVSSVIPDSPIVGPAPMAGNPGASPAGAPVENGTAVPGHALKAPPGACSATPQLEPEGLALTGTDSAVRGAKTARSLGFTGAGVKVAFLADGIDTANANLVRGRKPVISDYKDFSGDGTNAPTAGGEAFLDANAIAGQGSKAYNVAGFSAQVPASPCLVSIEGTAPGASLVALKVFSNSGVSTTSGFLQAIDYAVSVDHVNVINESFGSNPFPDVTSLEAVKEFNDLAVRAGTTVVVASGDAGPFNTIGSPASDPNVISVGASTDFRFYAQTNYAGADQFAPRGWESDNISSLSSGGYTQDGRTLDLVAPGDLSFASCTPNVARYADCVNFLGKPSPVEESGGTSQSSPAVAGAAALVFQAYEKAHHGTPPSPAAVKQILLSTATDLGAPATEQGTGLLNSLKAVELASWAPHRDPAGPTLKLSADQLNYVGRPGATASWSVTVTNAARAAQTVAVSGRGFSAGSVVKQATVTLSDAKSPRFTNWAGTASNFGTVKFSVPRGQALLNASVAWPASVSGTGNLNARVRVILVDPAGRLAAHSLPQGVGGYGSAQVLHPAAGSWTAVIFSDTAKAGGTAGTVRFGASVSSAQPFGTVSPSTLVLAPGASDVVHVSARVPAGAGDSSGSVVFATAGPGQRAGHAARAGAGAARRDRDLQRGADRRQRARAGRGAGRRLLLHGAVRPRAFQHRAFHHRSFQHGAFHHWAAQPARHGTRRRRRRDARQRPGQPGQRLPGRAGRRDDGLRVELPHHRVRQRRRARGVARRGSSRCTRRTRSLACGRSSSTSRRRCRATSLPTRSPGGSGSTPCQPAAGRCPTRPRPRSPRASRSPTRSRCTTRGRPPRTSSSTRG